MRSGRVVPMASTITPDQLADRIKDVLKDYAEDVELKTVECVKAVAKEGVRALKSNSPHGKTGEYAKGWTQKTETTRLGSTATIYNRDYRLPHLLEWGHVTRNGTGRQWDTKAKTARPHIEAVENTLIREFEHKLISEVKK